MKLIDKYFKVKILILSILMMTLVFSCYKDRLEFDKISGGIIHPNMAVPLVYGDLTMAKVVSESKEIWKEYPDGLLSLIYRGENISDFADQIISFPNQSQDTNLRFSFPPNIFPGSSAFKRFQLKPTFRTSTNERIDSILVKSGVVTFEITTDLNHPGTVEIIIPTMTKYGATFIVEIPIQGTGGVPTTFTKTVSIYDYIIRFNHPNAHSNQIAQDVKITVNRGNNADNSPYNITLKQSMTAVKYYQVFGFFDQHTFNVPNTSIPITIFDNLRYSQILIENPTLTLSFKNSYGLPMDMVFTSLYVKNGGLSKNLTSSLLPALPLNYPDFTQVGTRALSQFTFDISNSNISDVVAFNPKKLIYEGYAQSNPGLPVPNFVLDTSRVSIDAELEIPLYGRAMTFVLQDTSEVDLTELYDWDEVVSVDLNINTMNYFPMDALLQVYLADSNNVIYDSIFEVEKPILIAATPGPAPDYRVTTPMHKLVKVNVSEQKLENLKKTQVIIFSAYASTYREGSEVVKIYSDYKIDFELSAKGVLNVEL